MLKKIIKLLKLLNSNSKASQIANSFCIGLILGLMPKGNLLWPMVFVFFLFVRINKACYGVMLFVGVLIAPYFDSLFDTVGYTVLTYAPLENTYAMLLDIPFVGFTKFNNTIVAGSLACGLLVYIPVYIVTVLFIILWRKTIAPAINRSKIARMVYQLPIVQKVSELTE